MDSENDAHTLRDRVANKLAEHLASHRAKELADKVGVSTPTINRWKNKRTAIAREHFLKLAEVLGMHDEMAQAGSLPLARGPVRKSELLPLPRRVVALLIRLLPPDLSLVMANRHDALTAFLHQSTRYALREGWAYRMGFAENWVQESRVSTRKQVFQLLDDAHRNAGVGDLLFVCVSSSLFRDRTSGKLVLGSEEGVKLELEENVQRSLRLGELADQLKQFGHKTLLAVQGLGPSNGGMEGAGEEMGHELQEYGRPGFAAITAEIPREKKHLEAWPMFDDDFCQDIRKGWADVTDHGQITVSDSWLRMVERVNRLNQPARERGAKRVFDLPHLLHPPFDSNVTLAAPPDLAWELSGEGALLAQLREQGIRSSWSEIRALTKPDPRTGTSLKKLRDAATKLGARVVEPGQTPEEREEAERFLRENTPFIAYVLASKLYPDTAIPWACGVAVKRVQGGMVEYFGPESFESERPDSIAVDKFIDAWADWGFTNLVVRSARNGRRMEANTDDRPTSDSRKIPG